MFIDANRIMELLNQRFPQADISPHVSEDEMVEALKNWRRNYTDTFSRYTDNDNTDEVIRFDTCINGYGTHGY